MYRWELRGRWGLPWFGGLWRLAVAGGRVCHAIGYIAAGRCGFVVVRSGLNVDVLLGRALRRLRTCRLRLWILALGILGEVARLRVAIAMSDDGDDSTVSVRTSTTVCDVCSTGGMCMALAEVQRI